MKFLQKVNLTTPHQTLIKTSLKLCLMLGLVFACHSQRKSLAIEKTENFDEFYVKFHSDSLFQVQRMVFPLEGGRYDYDTEEKWTRENWRMKKVTVYQVDPSEFSVELNKEDTMVFERIYIPNSGFDFQCRYKLIDGKWYMVYCLDQNL